MIDKNNTQHQRRPGLTLGECLTQNKPDCHGGNWNA